MVRQRNQHTCSAKHGRFSNGSNSQEGTAYPTTYDFLFLCDSRKKQWKFDPQKFPSLQCSFFTFDMTTLRSTCNGLAKTEKTPPNHKQQLSQSWVAQSSTSLTLCSIHTLNAADSGSHTKAYSHDDAIHFHKQALHAHTRSSNALQTHPPIHSFIQFLSKPKAVFTQTTNRLRRN